MASQRDVTYADLQRASEGGDPEFADLVIQYLQQSDPPQNAPEDPDDDDAANAPLSEDAWTLQRLRKTVSPERLRHQSASEQHAARREAWSALLAAAHPPPRLQLGALLVSMYERGDEASRTALTEIFRKAKLGWGIWQGLKQIYKLAEQRHDAAMFGVLAYRLDAYSTTPLCRGEISAGTFIYMRRRAWRYLRQLGHALPELYPQFAVEVLRHYPAGFSFWASWTAAQIWAHESMMGMGRGGMTPPKDLKRRAFPEAWKAAPEPLLRLLEDAHNNDVCDFAIRSLKGDHPDALRDIDPAWLARIGRKPLPAVHEFVVEVLMGSPRFHQSKLRELGLHDLVLSLLRSSSDAAQKYAIEYARAHEKQLDLELLIELAIDGGRLVSAFAAENLAKRTPADLGLPALVRLLASRATFKLASEKFKQGFAPTDIDTEQFIVLRTGTNGQRTFLSEFYTAAKLRPPTGHLVALLESDKLPRWQRNQLLRELGNRSIREIGIEWVKQAVLHDEYGPHVAQWLRTGKVESGDLDVEWLKGLVMRPRLRALALEVLGNPKRVAPRRLGLPWLLALLRQADEALHGFAHQHMLEHFAPNDFADGGLEPSLDTLWNLASGPQQPETTREFASVYLRAHHPELGPTLPEAKAAGIEPKLTSAAYPLSRVRAVLEDSRADVRRLGQAIAGVELVRWNDPGLVYELASSRHREPRSAAGAFLLKVGDDGGPPADWLQGARVFALAESPHKAAREVALTLIRRHYDRLGGAQRLAWLMESPDREVRLFAVRLLWERHRPSAGNGQRGFDTIDALRNFLRTVMFGLPPGRLERRELTGGALPDRSLPASVAKHRLIDVVRQMATDDRGFAELVLPVLQSFRHSRARGESEGCITALAQIRRAHPDLAVGLPPGEIELRPPKRRRIGATFSA